MRLKRGEPEVELSVGEFARFALGPSRRSGWNGSAARWRAQLGNSWHLEMQERARSQRQQGDELRFEEAVDAYWQEQGWRLRLTGRVDQILEREGTVVLREIKTVNSVLPAPVGELQEGYPEHFVQAGTYHELAKILPAYQGRTIFTLLVFVSIADGTVQEVEISQQAPALFATQKAELLGFLRGRAASWARLSHPRIRPPFGELRPGQAEAQKMLARHATETTCLCFEAPTGFGKTGLALEFALGQMRDGIFDRLIYLTGKSTGQTAVMQQLAEMLPDTDAPWFFQIRNQREHGLTPEMRRDPDLRTRQARNWQRAALRVESLFEANTLPLERIIATAAELDVCPYEVSRCALAHAEIWVGDYNYLFSPGSEGILTEQPGFDPARTIVIIDESHNLPERVADACSLRFQLGTVAQLAAALSDQTTSRQLVRAVDLWTGFLERLTPGEALTTEDEYEAADLLEHIARASEETPLDWSALTAEAADELWQLAEAPDRIADLALNPFMWCPRTGILEVKMLDASSLIRAKLDKFGQALLMSATLTPASEWLAACGLNEEQARLLKAEAPWRENAYRVAIDSRVDTRYQQRSKSYEKIARTIIRMVETAAGPVAVFFSSFRYAEAVAVYLEALSPLTRIARQPRGISLAEQSHFIEEGLLSFDVLFLVLGTGFSEGIDSLGARVEDVAVVGPALPEVNPVQKAREANHPGGGKAAFREIYQIPGIRKINQALGRVVRSPEQRARVLLLGQRFAQADYRELLSPEYRKATLVRNKEELESWLRGSD
jgi:Rad3-related DNA helicase